MRARPVRLNTAIGSLFAVGSACFVLGSLPAYLNRVGETADGPAYFIGALFFTAASFGQLVQAQSPAMTGPDSVGQETPRPGQDAGLAAARPWLAGGHHPVPGHAALQREHDLGPRAQCDGQGGGPTGLAS